MLETARRTTLSTVLRGCTPVPLANYLKGLAVLRLVAEQVDDAARGSWVDGRFVLHSHLDVDALVEFLLRRYSPTPVIAPWNGGSGFNPKDNQDGIGPIAQSSTDRLIIYRKSIDVARSLRNDLDITDKVADQPKQDLQNACRANLPDEALVWFDAAIVMTTNGPAYPALLGTGGNDGRLDFSNNFMQRIVDVINPTTGEPTVSSKSWLQGALFGTVIDGLQSLAIGQFDPGGAGGANGTSGFVANALVNPWDFILMIEGALLFAAASSKRLGGAASVLACPFSVHAAGVGYLSAAAGDEKKSRSELWCPLWESPASLPELRALMSEGRAQVGMRPAHNGVDFARAVATLGVDRGLTAFQRFAFQERNGQAYLALPLGQYEVEYHKNAELLTDLDQGDWLESVRRAASADTAPASIQRALRALDVAIIKLCHDKSDRGLRGVLVEVGRVERALARSLKWTRERFLHPCPLLQERWIERASDNSPLWRLAVSLASIRGRVPLRLHFEPVRARANGWSDTTSLDVVWHEGDSVDVMNKIVARRLLLAVRSEVPRSLGLGRVPAELDDIIAFIQGGVDASQLMDLTWGLCLVGARERWPGQPAYRESKVASLEASLAEEAEHADLHEEEASSAEAADILRHPPPALYSLMVLTLARHRLGPPSRTELDRQPADAERIIDLIPLVPDIHYRAAHGASAQAVDLALRRLRASGFIPSLRDAFDGDTTRVKRCAAAMLFPISGRTMKTLAGLLQIRVEKKEETQS